MDNIKRKPRKALWCEDCEHYNPQTILEDATDGEKEIIGMEFDCKKGHKPYYYKPKNWNTLINMSEFGYKRRCEDFSRAKDGVI